MHGGVGVIPLHPVESSSSPRSVLYPICTVSYRILLFASLVLSLNSRTHIHYTTHHYYYFLFFFPLLYPFVSIRSFSSFSCHSPLPSLSVCAALHCTSLHTQHKISATAAATQLHSHSKKKTRNKREKKGFTILGVLFIFHFFLFQNFFSFFFPIISHYFICIFGVAPHSLIFCFYCLLLGFLLLLLIHPAPTALTGCVGLAVCLRAAYYFG